MQRIPSSHLPAVPRRVVRIERGVVIRSDGVGGVNQDASNRLDAPSASLFTFPGRAIIGGQVKPGRRALGEVAALGDRPLVVDLEEDRPGAPEHGRLVSGRCPRRRCGA